MTGVGTTTVTPSVDVFVAAVTSERYVDVLFRSVQYALESLNHTEPEKSSVRFVSAEVVILYKVPNVGLETVKVVPLLTLL